MDWADRVIVMEDMHRDRIKEHTGSTYLGKIEVLDIPDEYKVMEPSLVELLLSRVEISS